MKAGDSLSPRHAPVRIDAGEGAGEAALIQLTVLVAPTDADKDRVLRTFADQQRAGAAVVPGGTNAPLIISGDDSDPQWRLPRRVHPTWQQLHVAEHAIESARRRLAELRDEAEQLGRQAEAALPRAAGTALRLASGMPQYRSQLLQLATVRARLVELERTSVACARQLGSAEDESGAIDGELGPWADELPVWQERVSRARAAHSAAECAAAEASDAVRIVCSQVSEELARDVFDGAHAVDVSWRRLWHLRRHLEDVWDVQSRAEANARALAERETTLREREAAAHWLPPRRLQNAWSAAAIAASVAALWAGMWFGGIPDPALCVIAAVLVIGRAVLFYKARFGGLREHARRSECEQLRRDIIRLRRGRDSDWARAAQLTAAIEAGAAALGLAAPVTPELVDACEQRMAATLRAAGGETVLAALLLDVSVKEEHEQHARAALAAAAAARRTIEREWAVWRAERALPAELDAAQIGAWLEARRGLIAARAARAAAHAELAALEPATASWEDAVRALLAAAGQPAPDLCGRALTAQLAALAHRVRGERQRARRRRRLADEMRLAEAEVAAAQAERERIQLARQNLRSDVGAAGRWVPALWDAAEALDGERRTLGAAGTVLASATGGAYRGFRHAEDGTVLVVDRADRAVPVADVRERGCRRCIELLLRIGDALSVPTRPLVLDDVLTALADDETAPVVAAIAAIAATHPLVYLASAATRERSLALLPNSVEVRALDEAGSQ